MKKLIIIFSISMILVVVLFVVAFFYIDLSGHKGFVYDGFVGNRPIGTFKVDRYETEEKIIYKERSDYRNSLGYPSKTAKLYLDKRTKMPLKYIEKAKGVKGLTRLIHIVQNKEKTDFLFLEQPRIFYLEDFETGEKTKIFSPYDIMLYVSIMEKYNYWEKGSQFFEIMIPTDESLPPMRDKLEIKYLNDEYVPVLGRRIEAEKFIIHSKGSPDARIYVSKYGHNILSLAVKKVDMKFVLASLHEYPLERLKRFIFRISSQIKRIYSNDPRGDNIDGGTDEDKLTVEDEVKASRNTARAKSQEVFFESDGRMLSGYFWAPAKDGTALSVLIVPEDGPMKSGEKRLIDSYGEILSSWGYGTMTFDSPGQGKSQGDFQEMDDKKRVRNIVAAIKFMGAHPSIKNNKIVLIGHKGGGALALEAAKELTLVSSCVLLGEPSIFGPEGRGKGISPEGIRMLLGDRALGPFDKGFISTVVKRMKERSKETYSSSESYEFFLGAKLPLKDNRLYLARKPYDNIRSSECSVLLILGKNESRFDLQAIDELKRAVLKSGRRVKIAVFRNLASYMGEMALKDGDWRFARNPDVEDSIKQWLKGEESYFEVTEKTGSI